MRIGSEAPKRQTHSSLGSFRMANARLLIFDRQPTKRINPNRTSERAA
jgi:hypothetical protein